VYTKEYPNLIISYEMFEYILVHFDLLIALNIANSSFLFACKLKGKIVVLMQ
jgi:hypothetical protein